MTIDEIKAKVHSNEYDFLRTNIHLGNKICLLGLGGSYAYGTNNENSDLDIRGCALNSKRDILTNENFEQVTNEQTDTVIYSFNKLISLLSNCNPNVIEMLGLKEEHYLYKNEVGQLLINNAGLFLSKKAIQSFGGYANAKKHKIQNSCLNNKPLTKINKYMMHIIRLLYMGIDILEQGKIITYRKNEHDLLMQIRNGIFTYNNYPTEDFFNLLRQLEKQFDYAKENTNLPDKPNYNQIKELMMYVNEKVVYEIF